MATVTETELKEKCLGNIISYVPAVENSYNENTDIVAEAAAPWRYLAQVSELIQKSETEDDAFNAFFISSKTYSENKNTQVKLDSFETTCREQTDYIESLRYREGATNADGSTVLFATNEPSQLVWLKLEKYTDSSTLDSVMLMYGRLATTGDFTENNKKIRPKLVFEVVPSAYNKKFSGTAWEALSDSDA